MSASSDPTPIDPPLDYYNHGPGMITSCTILAFIATVCVILRFWSKTLIHAQWQIDDYLALLALVFHHALMISGFISVTKGGLGRDIRLVVAKNPNATVTLFKALFASEIIYGLASSTIKLAVLVFYHRTFPTTTVRLGCYVLGVICIGWVVAIEFVNVIQCRPLKAKWHLELRALPGTKCVDIILYFFGNSTVNCVIDLATLVLPVQEVIKLRITTRKKIGVASIFLFGGMAFAASLARTISTAIIHHEGITNFTKQFVLSGAVSVVEISVSIIGACLPTLVPIYRKIRYGDARMNSMNRRRSEFSLSGDVSGTNSYCRAVHALKNGKSDTIGWFDRVHDGDSVLSDALEDGLTTVDYTHPRTGLPGVSRGNGGNYHPGMTVLMQGIVVKSDVRWSDANVSMV